MCWKRTKHYTYLSVLFYIYLYILLPCMLNFQILRHFLEMLSKTLLICYKRWVRWRIVSTLQVSIQSVSFLESIPSLQSVTKCCYYYTWNLFMLVLSAKCNIISLLGSLHGYRGINTILERWSQCSFCIKYWWHTFGENFG